MLGKYQYWLYQEQLDKKTCAKIVKHFDKIKHKSFKGKVGIKSKVNKGVRDSNVVFSNESSLYSIIGPYIDNANIRAGWNVDVDWNETIQFSVYNKKQHYDWHTDSLEAPYGKESAKMYQGKIRKLSCCVSLTDPKKYEGGEFYFSFGKDKTPIKIPEFKKQGSLLVFPSFIFHKVTPVTKGTRHSLVNWSLGAPWR